MNTKTHKVTKILSFVFDKIERMIVSMTQIVRHSSHCHLNQLGTRPSDCSLQWVMYVQAAMYGGYYKIVMLSIYIIASTHLLYNVNNTI